MFVKRNLCLTVAIAISSILITGALFSCATIMHGSSQEIGIQSSPTGATVTVDDQDFGKTPVIAKLSRKKSHKVHFALEGFEPYDATITRSTSGWVWGNIVFGGLIGLGIDAITGGLYKLKPEQVKAVLISQESSDNMQGVDIIITVVLKPDPSWEKIGNLVPTNR